VYKLRTKLFIKLLRLPVSFYDKPGNTPGGISTKLSQDSHEINNMVTGIIGVVCLNISTVTISLIIALVYFWQLTLVVLALSPLMVITGAINMKVMKSMSMKSEKFEKYVGSMISDTVCNIRTVKSFGNEDVFMNIFIGKLDELSKLSSSKQLRSSFLQGLSRGSVMFIQGFTFWIAAILFVHLDFGPESAPNIFIATFSIIFAAMGVGQNSQFLPDMGKAKKAGASMYEILETVDEVEEAAGMEDKALGEIQGDIEFKNVKFKYPEREAIVLKNFSLKINKGDKVGFAGPSGSGKSTIAQILMRFYPIQEGEILVDGVDYRKYNLLQYRLQLGLVSQEPALFLGTARENIIYNSNAQPDEEMRIAEYCKISHSADFISKWPESTWLFIKNSRRRWGRRGARFQEGRNNGWPLLVVCSESPKL
jgi:ATP-binding cassette subfamily B (MDR/TAP) protein 1